MIFDGAWNEAGAVAAIVGPPAFYRTAWFAALSVGCVLGLLWMIYRLRPRQISASSNDLADALQGTADELSGEGSSTFRLVVEGTARDLDRIFRAEVKRIACESLRNAYSHARARQIEVEITYGERLFRLRIRDDGRGIPPDILEAPGHSGLSEMRERAHQIGAKLAIWSGPRSGTEIDLTIPGPAAYCGSSRRARLQVLRALRQRAGGRS
jgi:signal transduction histidine kinase